MGEQDPVTITIPLSTVKLIVDAVWSGQFETMHAAENSVCAYDCQDDTWHDFVAHKSTCAFIKVWQDIQQLRDVIGDTRKPTIEINEKNQNDQ